ncbi:hypothetical protein MKX03_003672 [Papaver bracteatum]|nr:hypothetical protein MKX03_003672 [Papaver bracteatum]
MATASLLIHPAFSLGSRQYKYSLNLNPFRKTFPTRHIHFQSIRKNTRFLITRSDVRVNCFIKSVTCKVFEEKKDKETEGYSVDNDGDDIIQVILRTVKSSIQVSAIAAIILGLLLTYDPRSALAASGGRMGGRAFSSSTSTSTSSSQPSYSSTSSSSGPSYSSYSSSSWSSSTPIYSSSTSTPYSYTTSHTTCSSVGLLGSARSLQKDLDKIAQVADSSTRSGLSYILQESALAVLRHPDYCISGYSYVDVKPDKEDGEKRFDELSMKERAKFDEETLVNVDKIKRQSIRRKRAHGFSNEYIVVQILTSIYNSKYFNFPKTILVASEGVHQLHAVTSMANLMEALQKLGSIPTSKILAVEVLWTPQSENDRLTETELLVNYPLLRPL